MGSATITVIRRATTLVQPDTGAPTYYELTQDANGSISHVECKFEGQQVHTWQWTEGSPKGDPERRPGDRSDAHSGEQRLFALGVVAQGGCRTTRRRCCGTVGLLTRGRQSQSFRLKRGEPHNLDVAGTTHACQTWLLEGAGVEILADAQSGQFLRMTVPAQKTTVLLADATVAQNVQQAPLTDLLTRHFAQSNVAFDDFLKVTSLKAKIDVSMIGEGVGQDARSCGRPCRSSKAKSRQFHHGHRHGSIDASCPQPGDSFPVDRSGRSKHGVLASAGTANRK